MDTKVVDDVFLSAGVPIATYVKQEAGKFEVSLDNGLRRKGRICLISGLSKSGKTTLWNTVARNRNLVPIVINCTTGMSAKDFWRVPLEKLNFDQLKDVSASKSSTKTGALKGALELNWIWLAKKTGELSGSISNVNTASEVRTRILAEPSASHLVPLLSETNAILVIEDFHYLNRETRIDVMQSWKHLSDKRISLIVVETIGSEAGLVKANSDMHGRVQSIKLKRWKVDDLLQIAQLGLANMGLQYTENPFLFIAEESMGLPIVMQQVCAQLFADRKIGEVRRGEKIQFLGQEAVKALCDVAISDYDSFSETFNMGCAQPTSGNQVSKLKCVLEPFFDKGPDFKTSQTKISDHVENEYQMPDRASADLIVEEVLGEILEYQAQVGVRIIDWKRVEKTVEIVESTFLLYVKYGQTDQG